MNIRNFREGSKYFSDIQQVLLESEMLDNHLVANFDTFEKIHYLRYLYITV
jgi:hypothetical protein